MFFRQKHEHIYQKDVRVFHRKVTKGAQPGKSFKVGRGLLRILQSWERVLIFRKLRGQCRKRGKRALSLGAGPPTSEEHQLSCATEAQAPGRPSTGRGHPTGRACPA